MKWLLLFIVYSGTGGSSMAEVPGYNSESDCNQAAIILERQLNNTMKQETVPGRMWRMEWGCIPHSGD